MNATYLDFMQYRGKFVSRFNVCLKVWNACLGKRDLFSFVVLLPCIYLIKPPLCNNCTLRKCSVVDFKLINMSKYTRRLHKSNYKKCNQKRRRARGILITKTVFHFRVNQASFFVVYSAEVQFFNPAQAIFMKYFVQKRF